jgi:cobalt/nickel transport protein
MVIGVGEGLISALVFLAVQRTRPEMILDTPTSPQRRNSNLKLSLLAVLGLVIFVAPFACPWPDGLESVAEKLGFDQKAVTSSLPAPMADYQAPGVHWAVGATAIAGGVGSLIVFGLALMLGWVLVPKQNKVDA